MPNRQTYLVFLIWYFIDRYNIRFQILFYTGNLAYSYHLRDDQIMCLLPLLLLSIAANLTACVLSIELQNHYSVK